MRLLWCALVLVLAPFAAGSPPAQARPLPVDRWFSGIAVVVADDGSDTVNSDPLGTAFAIDRSGFLVTSAHVVSGRQRVRLLARDGREYGATVAGADPLTDVAIVRVGADAPFAPWPIGPTLPAVGSRVFALGHPMNQRFTLTAGVVSGLDRAYDGKMPVALIQHDAALNPGSSGGPLLSADGRWLGMNVATPRETLFDVGIGFAVPARTVSKIATRLVRDGRIVRGSLGVMVSSADRDAAALLGSGEAGLLVDWTLAGQVDLQPGDLLLTAAGSRVRRPRDLAIALLDRRPGERVTLRWMRAGKPMQAEVRLAEAPPPQAALTRAAALAPGGSVAPFHGLTVRDGQGGLDVVAVVPESPAERVGLSPGDRILAINGRRMSRAESASAALAAPRALVLIERRDGTVAHLLLQPQTASGHAGDSLSAGPY